MTRRILVVDNAANIREEIIRRYSEMVLVLPAQTFFEGCQILDGKDGIALIVTELMDLQQDVVSIVKFMQRVRENAPLAPRIAYTNLSPQEILKRRVEDLHFDGDIQFDVVIQKHQSTRDTLPYCIDRLLIDPQAFENEVKPIYFLPPSAKQIKVDYSPWDYNSRITKFPKRNGPMPRVI